MIYTRISIIALQAQDQESEKRPLTDDLPVVFGLQQQMEGQPAAGELTGQEAVLQEICALHFGRRTDSLVGLEVVKEASCL